MTTNTKKGFRTSIKVVVIILVVALLISYAVFEILLNRGKTPFRINIIIPWGLIAVVISFYFFGENNRIRNAKRDNRREHSNERREEILNTLRKKNINETAELKNKSSDDKND